MKFKLTNQPHTVQGEAERFLRAHMRNHDNKNGLGGYYLNRQDVSRVRKIIGCDADAVLSGAGFKPHPRYRHQLSTGARSPAGDDAKIRLIINFKLLESIVKFWRNKNASAQES